MTRSPVTVDPDESLYDCAKKMVRKRINSVPIVDHKKLVGFISQKDILWAIVKKRKKALSNIKATSISPKKVVTIKPTESVNTAISKMNKYKFDRLPVVGKDHELVGIITVRDVLSFSPELYPELEEFARIREAQEKLNRVKRGPVIKEGICEECGTTDVLYRINGMLVCESCMSSM